MKNVAFALLIASIAASPAAARASGPVRPPNGTYVYSMNDSKGAVVFESTIRVKGRGATFTVSETTKLPNGASATTDSTWSNATLSPLSFDLYQGKLALHARFTPEKLIFTGMPASLFRTLGLPPSFARLRGTSSVLPSVGLISTDLMFAYFLHAHPRESLTLAEIQNDQTVLVRPSSSVPSARSGYAAIAITKQEKHGQAGDQERIVAWLNLRDGIIGDATAHPGDYRITLRSFARSEP